MTLHDIGFTTEEVETYTSFYEAILYSSTMSGRLSYTSWTCCP